MTNRQKLIQTNIFDLLCNMNKAMIGFRCDCIYPVITNGKYDVPDRCELMGQNCGECIAKWLGEEVD